MKFKNLANITDLNNSPSPIFPVLGSVIDHLNVLSTTVTDRHLTDEKFIDIVNEELKDSNIVFKPSKIIDYASSKFEDTLYDRNMYRIGDIYKQGDKCVIEFLPGIADTLSKPSTFKLFVKYILPCIGHEFIHQEQGVVGGISELSDKYLQQPHEVMAFAYVAGSELFRKFKGNKTFIRDFIDNNTVNYKVSPHFSTYVEVFADKKDEVLDKFKNFIYQYIDRPETFSYLL